MIFQVTFKAATLYNVTNSIATSSGTQVSGSSDYYYVQASDIKVGSTSSITTAAAGETVSVTVNSAENTSWSDNGTIKLVVTTASGKTVSVSPDGHDFTADGQTQAFTFVMPAEAVTLTLTYTA